MDTSVRNPRYLILLLMGMLFVFFLVIKSSVRYTDSDMRWDLLSSQALIQHKVFYLDDYAPRCDNFKNDYRIQIKKGHYYNYMPPGSSFLSFPFVFGATLLGKDMVNRQDNQDTQIFIAAILCAFVYAFLYYMCRSFISPLASLTVAGITVLGSGLMSTMGTALWSIDYMVFLECFVLCLLARHATGAVKTLNPYLIAAVLFLSFFCRPTSATFIMFVVVYVGLKERTILLRMCFVMMFLLALFVLFSWTLYGSILPGYYEIGRISGNVNWTAMAANLWSPSRGIFIFSPVFILIVIGSVLFFKRLKNNFLFWGIVFVSVTLMLVITRQSLWWLGYCFGPRGLTELLPLWILLMALLWRETSRLQSHYVKNVIVIIFFILGAMGIYINTKQGLYNVNTLYWNIYPNIDKNPEYVFDWKYPQFLASQASQKSRWIEHTLKH